MISTKNRSNQSEEMDDFDFSGPVLTKTLNQIANINKWLGGNEVTINGLKKLLKDCPKDKKLTVVDLGCGNGDMLRVIASYGKKKGIDFNLIGVDANQHTIDYARELSKEYAEISYVMQDVLADDFEGIPCDIVLATLFMHHFKKEEITTLVTSMLNRANAGIIINDLHRNKIAFGLFQLLCLTFIRDEISKNDGLISIASGFKRSDFEKYGRKAKFNNDQIIWKWSFRFIWLISIYECEN